MPQTPGTPHGPLAGLRILDLSSLGPAPFASMILADFGGEVLSIQRPDPLPFDPAAAMTRGKTSMGVNLRHPDGQAVIRRLSSQADILLEGFRPGVMERLGLGPDDLIPANPGLIYGRLTGWGQTGPLARQVGHDINYLAVSGALGVTGEDRPIAPPALLGDLANGSYLMVIGLLLAVIERHSTGRGQVVDAAIVDGAAYMLTALFGELAQDVWDGSAKTHLLRGAAPFYGVYQCSDGRWFSVGAIEPKFYAQLLSALELDDVDASPRAQMDQRNWPGLRERIAGIFATRTQAEWTRIFAPMEACGAPVLDLDELADHPHIAERGTVTRVGGQMRAAPAPRLSTHPELVEELPDPRPRPAADILTEAGFDDAEIKALEDTGIVWSA